MAFSKSKSTLFAFASKLKPRLCRSHGIGKLTLLVFGILTAALLYSAYCILPFYYYYFELQSHMEQMIRAASTNTDVEIRQKLGALMKFNRIPANPSDIKITRRDKQMKISLDYEEIFYVSWMDEDYDLHVFEFNPQAEGEMH